MGKRLILHIDMNSFFASCEQVKDPSLRNQPLIVGGDPETRRGIVLAASYEAKAYGVKTTMLISEAARLCPTAKIIKSSHGLYGDMSQKVMAIFDEYTPLKQQVSIDEAFLDMTGSDHLFGPPLVMAKTIQDRIMNELDLPSSVGIAHNKLLAKMASDYKKPMGITSIFEEDISTKLWPLSVGNLYGIGKKTVPKLEALGIKTIGDLAKHEFVALEKAFGYKGATYMKASANGQGSDIVTDVIEKPKSVGNEITYAKDIASMDVIHEELLLLSDKVGYRLRKHMLTGRTISIKIKYATFKVEQRSKTIAGPTHHTKVIYDVACELMKELWSGKPIRLLGVSVSGFMEEEVTQLSLFSMETEPDHADVDHMVDDIRKRFGYDMIKPASLLDKKKN